MRLRLRLDMEGQTEHSGRQGCANMMVQSHGIAWPVAAPVVPRVWTTTDFIYQYCVSTGFGLASIQRNPIKSKAHHHQ